MSLDEHTERLRSVLYDADGGPFEPDLAELRGRARRLAAARRRGRAGGGLAAVAASAALILGLTQLTGDDQGQQVVTDDPDGSVAPAPDAIDDPDPSEDTEPPVPDASAPDASDSTEGAPDSSAGPWVGVDAAPGIYPFTTGEAADAWAAEPGAVDYTDPAATALDFATNYVGLDVELVAVRGIDARSSEVEVVGRLSRRSTFVIVRALGASNSLTVIGAASDIELPEPGTMVTIASPVRVRGTAPAVAVVVELRDDAGAVLVDRYVDHGGDELDATIDFGPPTAGAGALIVYGDDATAAPREWATVLRIGFAPPGGDSAFAWPAGDPLRAELLVAVVAEPGVEEGVQRLVVVDRSTGDIVSDLVPGVGDSEGGILDVALSPDRRSIFYAVSTSACESEVRVIGASGQADPVVVGPGADVAVSPDGTRLAVVVDPDCDGHDQLRVIDLGASRPGDLVFVEWDELIPDGAAEGLIVWLDHLTWVGPVELLYQVTFKDGVQVQRHDLTDPTLLSAGAAVVSSVDPLTRGFMTPGGTAPWVANQCVGHQEGSCPIELVTVDPDTGEAVGEAILSPAIVTNIGGSQPVWTTASGELYAWQGSEGLRLDAPASMNWVDVAD